MKRKIDVEKRWNKNVEEAKKCLAFLRLTTAHRMRVVEICLDCCKIFHGGRVDSYVNTRAKFAHAIGLNKSTLYEWIAIHDVVYKKLTDDQKVDADKNFNSLIEVRRKMRNSRGAKTEKVRETFTRELAINGVAKRFRKYTQHVNSILYNAKNPRRIVEVPTKILEEMTRKLAEALGLFQQEIRFRTENGHSATHSRYKEKQMDVADIWEKVGVTAQGGEQ